MSEDQQYRDELEKMLQEEADQFALKPSEKVWQKVNKELHPHSREKYFIWLALPILLAVLGAGGYLMLHHHGNEQVPVTLTSQIPGNNHQAALPTGNSGNKPAADQSFPNAQPASPQKMNILANTRRKESSPGISVSRGSNIVSGAGNPPIYPSPHPESLKKTITPAPEKREPPAPPGDSAAAFARHNASSLPAAPLPPKADADSASADRDTLKDLSTHESPPIAKAVKAAGRPRWEIYFTPSRSYRFLHLAKGTGSTFRGKLQDNVSSGFSAGLQVKWHLRGQWYFATGAQFSRMQYTIRATGAYPAYLDASGAPAYGQTGRNSFFTVNNYALSTSAAISHAALRNSYTYAGIPLLLEYEVPLKNKWILNLASGIGIDYLAAKTINILSPGNGRYFTDNSKVNNWNSLFQFSPSLSVPLPHSRFCLQAGPEFEYQIFSTYKHYDVKERPYSIGFRFGIGFQ